MWRCCFARIRLNPLSRKILHHDRVRVIVSGFTSLFETLWSAVTKSPNFSVWGTASPCVFCKSPSVILVLKQTSQFRSFGTWVLMLYFLVFVTTFVGCSESESWEMCAGAGTSASSKLSVKSCNENGRSANGSFASFLSPGGLLVTSIKFWTWRWARCSSVSRCLLCFWSQRFLW